MAYATILVRFFLSPGRLIKKVGRDVTDGDFVRTDRTCVSGSGGNYPDPACLDARVKYRNCSVMLDCDV